MSDIAQLRGGGNLAEVLEQVRQLRNDFTTSRAESREDRGRLEDKVDALEARFNHMEQEISSGKGMVQALIWVGGLLLTITATASGLFEAFFRK